MHLQEKLYFQEKPKAKSLVRFNGTADCLFLAQASHNLRHRFPDAAPEQLADAPEGCAICKDGMQVRGVSVAV